MFGAESCDAELAGVVGVATAFKGWKNRGSSNFERCDDEASKEEEES